MLARKHSDQVTNVEADQSRVQVAEREAAGFEQYIYMNRLVGRKLIPNLLFIYGYVCGQKLRLSTFSVILMLLYLWRQDRGSDRRSEARQLRPAIAEPALRRL